MSHREQTLLRAGHTSNLEGLGLLLPMQQERSDGPWVLVVEDDVLVSETIVSMLEEHHAAAVVDSVDRALSYLTAEVTRGGAGGPGLILLDCLLPGGGLVRLLRLADQRGIPVVLISGDPARATEVDAGRAFLAKPFNQQRLLQALRTVLG